MERYSESKKLTIIAFFLFFLIILSYSARAGAIFDDDVEILQSDESGVTLRYTVPTASVVPYAEGDFDLLNIARTAQNTQEGAVQIPLKIVPLAMPPGARIRVTVQASAYESLPFKRIAPYFARPSADELKEAYKQARTAAPIIPDYMPYISSTGKIRGLNVARLAIPTARYSLASQELSVLKTITVRVDFVGGNKGLAVGFRDPGPVYGRMMPRIIANYDIGRNWYLSRSQLFTRTTVENATPFDSASTWIRIELVADGIYGFGWPQFSLIGVNPLNIDPSRIRLFYGGGKELPIPNSQPRPQLTEIPIKIVGGDDGRFDNGDLIIFYADGVDSWDYSEQFHRFQRYKDHYTDKNVYWLTTDWNYPGSARQIASFDGSPNGPVDVSVDSYRAVFHKEQETIFIEGVPFSGDFEWYWGTGRSFSAPIQLTDLVPGQDVTVVVRTQSGYPSLIVNGGSPIPPSSNQTYSTYHSTSFVNGANSVQLNSTSDITLDYIDVEYPRWLKVTDGTMTFAQPDTFGTIRYNLTEVISPYYLFDISDRNNPVQIINGSLNGSNLVFDDTVSAQSHKRYSIAASQRLKSPGAVALYQMDNLRDAASPQNRADGIIVTYDGYYDQAERLAQHHQQVFGLTDRVVKISDIYNQFSYGLDDPTAIRDFLKYAYENWQEPGPAYAVLFGDGNYDYRNYLGNNQRNHVPPFENTQQMGDDNYIYFGNNGFLDSDTNFVVDMFIGRISARSAQEGDDIVSKIIDYDSNPDLGPWRNRIVVAADDNLHPENGGYSNTETWHTQQAESLTRHIPNSFEINKIYMLEYLMGPGGEKPEARDALISAFNQGALIVNWIGHGSANLWADEHIFRRIQDIPRLTNVRRLPLIFTASCSIGRFDVPGIESMAEEFVRDRVGGAISVISATRDVYAPGNEALNNALFDQLLAYDSISVGLALYTAKFLRTQPGGVQPNDRVFMIFGDPVQILQFPKYNMRINTAPDSLVALSVDSLSGDVTDAHGNLESDFNGTAWITVKDGSVRRQVTVRDRLNNPLPPPNTYYYYNAPGATIFIGPADVVNGHFTSRFFIPKDITYGSHGAKIYVYGNNDSYDAVGIKDSLLVSGSLPSVQDSIGPSVTLLVNDRPFGEGITMVPSDFNFGADVYDEHGINITGQLGHGMVVKVDGGDVYEGDITGYFQYNQGDYQRGRLEARLPTLPLGEHEISLKVWDNFNNSTLITKRIEAVSTDNLELSDVMNYPNPIRKGVAETAFQYCLNDDVDRVTIKIFTEAGKRIKTIDIISSDLTRMDCNEVNWNLLDADGDHLANGIYLYKVTAEKRLADGSSEHADKTGKLVILR
jgi:hypothetical protein